MDLQGCVDFKRELLNRGIVFNDGYEDILFQPNRIQDGLVINKGDKSQNIEKASHDINIISLDTFRTHCSELELNLFIDTLGQEIFNFKGSQPAYFKLASISKLQLLNSVINL
jgi:hypothetical protein